MHRSDVVKIYYFLVTRAEKAKGEGKKEDEIYGREANILFLPPIGVEVSLKYFLFVAGKFKQLWFSLYFNIQIQTFSTFNIRSVVGPF